MNPILFLINDNQGKGNKICPRNYTLSWWHTK